MVSEAHLYMKRGLPILVALLAIGGCGSDDPATSDSDELPSSEPDTETAFSCESRGVERNGGVLEVVSGTDAKGGRFSVALRGGNDGYASAVYREEDGNGGGGLDLRDTNSPPMQRQFFSYGFGQSSFAGTATPEVASVKVVYPSSNNTKVDVDACLGAVSEEDGQALGAPGAFDFWFVAIPAPQPLYDEDVERIEQGVEIVGLDADGQPVGRAAPPEPSHGPEKTTTATTGAAED